MGPIVCSVAFLTVVGSLPADATDPFAQPLASGKHAGWLVYLTCKRKRSICARLKQNGSDNSAPPEVAADANRDLPSLFTALEEQLGLKLAATRGPAEVLVIDRSNGPHRIDKHVILRGLRDLRGLRGYLRSSA